MTMFILIVCLVAIIRQLPNAHQIGLSLAEGRKAHPSLNLSHKSFPSISMWSRSRHSRSLGGSDQVATVIQSIKHHRRYQHSISLSRLRHRLEFPHRMASRRCAREHHQRCWRWLTYFREKRKNMFVSETATVSSTLSFAWWFHNTIVIGKQWRAIKQCHCACTSNAFQQQ